MVFYDGSSTGDCAIRGKDVTTFLQTLVSGLEAAYTRYGALGYPLPPRPYQVYVVPVLSGKAPAITYTNHTVISPSWRDDLAAVAAHEYFHAIQWNYQQACPVANTYGRLPGPLSQAWYDNEDLRWWMEATAQWAQHEAIPTDVSYTAVIPDHLNNSWIHMDTRPIWGGTGIPYSPLFPFYLIEKLNPGQVDKDIIRNTWAQYGSNGNCGPIKPVIDSVLPQGRKMSNIFPAYAEANYFLAYPPPPDIRADLRANAPQIPPDFRPASDKPILDERTSFVTGPAGNIGGGVIEPLAAGYVEFNNGFNSKDKGRALRIAVNVRVINPSVTPAVRVWTIGNNFPPAPNAAPAGLPVPLTNQGNNWRGSITIQNFDSGALQWVGMQIVNPQTAGTNLVWDYRAEIIAPTPTPTSTRTATPLPSTATRTP